MTDTTRYYLDRNGWGDLALWRDNGDDDPTEVDTQHANSGATLAQERWRLLLRGASLDPDTVCVPREDLEIVTDSVAGEAGPADFTDAVRRLSLALFAAGAEATR